MAGAQETARDRRYSMSGAEQLYQMLERMGPHGRSKFDIAVTTGCDEHGEGEFFSATGCCLVGDDVVDSSADGVLEPGSPVIIFDGGERETCAECGRMWEGIDYDGGRCHGCGTMIVSEQLEGIKRLAAIFSRKRFDKKALVE